MAKNSYLLIALLAITQCSLGASFDCTKAASSLEKLICNNEDISSLDDQLAKSYKSALEKASDKESLKKGQVEWLKQQRLCKDVACLSSVYQERISVLNGQASSSLIASAASQSSQSSTAFYSGKLKLTRGGEFPICNLIFTVLENPKNRIPLGQSIDSLAAIKGVTLPEWQEISHDEFLKIILPDSYNEKSVTDFYENTFTKYPNFKHYRAKVSFDREISAEYFAVKSEFNDTHYFFAGAFNILKSEKELDSKTNQNLYGRIFFYQNETYFFDGQKDGNVFSISKTSLAASGGIGQMGWCEYHAIN